MVKEYAIVKQEREHFQFNAIQQGEALELLTSLANNSVDLIFFDPQYEKVSQVLKLDYPLQWQSDEEISQLLEEIERVLKPSRFCLLWVNKTILGTERVSLWLTKAPGLKIVDLLVWYKANTLGLGSWFRSQSEFAFLVQKYPTNSKKFKNRSFGNVWIENSLPTSKRNHPHQKPKRLIKALVEATTSKGDLVVDPCAGGFVVLEVCREIGREFLGVDLTYKELGIWMKQKFKSKTRKKICLNCFGLV